MKSTNQLARIARAAASLAPALSLIPTLAWSAPTPPPPAPQQPVGEVKVIEETPGTRTVVDAAGNRHVVMRKVTPAQRKAAAARAKATREAAAARNHAGSPASPASNDEVTK
jgi:hypothetical protein